MGEGRTKARLTNAGDEVLVRRGLLEPDQVRSYEADAMADTGGVRCVLPQHVVDQPGLAIVGHRVVEYADGRLGSVPITEAFALEIQGREEEETALILGDEVLIGQTALAKMDLLPDCTGRRLIPNPAHPDQPVTKVKPVGDSRCYAGVA